MVVHMDLNNCALHNKQGFARHGSVACGWTRKAGVE
jgi:hypothetical protein